MYNRILETDANAKRRHNQIQRELAAKRLKSHKDYNAIRKARKAKREELTDTD